ncbi:DUF6199 family natural product biosynthesis protein [Clostridium polynesiense]|uniref:DUF6199 family natural product biosynthesis protein n=1 Tax=Clostridium polynesiense TaxID=1325933 RepID=UPI000693D0D0|nr:DUF6199 family natural product biosynthesis protein [Clostridium polynesiense]
MKLYEIFLYTTTLIILGLAMLFKPELLWKIEHFLTTKDGEPSDFYVASMRIGGVLFALIGVIMLIYELLSKLL